MPYRSCSRCSARFHRAAVDSEGELCSPCEAPLVEVSRLRPPVVGIGRDGLVELVQQTFVATDVHRSRSGCGA